MRYRLRALLVGALCSSCLEGGGAAWPDQGSDARFLYRVSMNGAISIERIGVEPGAALTTALTSEEQLYLVAATAETLEASYPSFSAAASLADLRLEGGEPPEEALCERYGTLDSLEDRLRVPLVRGGSLAHVGVWRFDRTVARWVSADRLPGAEAIQLSYRPARCLAERSYVRAPFGVGTTTASVELLAAMSPTRALVSNTREVRILDRSRGQVGAAWAAETLAPPANAPGGMDAGRAHWELTRLAVDPNAPNRVLATVSYVIPDEVAFASAVIGLRVDELGVSFEARLFYTEALPSTAGGLEDVAFGPDGAWLAAGFNFAVTATTSTGRVRRVDTLLIPALEVEWVSDPSEPHWLFTKLGDIWRGDAIRDPGGMQRLPSPVARDVHATAADNGADSSVFYVSAQGPVLARVEDDWTPIPVWMSQEAKACSGSRTECGRLVAAGEVRGSRIESLAYDRRSGALFYASAGCSAVFALDPIQGCARTIALDEPVTFTDDLSPGDVVPKSMVLVGDELWVGGREGLLEVIALE